MAVTRRDEDLVWSLSIRFQGSLLVSDSKSEEWEKVGKISLESCSQISRKI